ncbi:TonB-dependent receptor plug domain-containing protein, partial [Sphingorhabdus sp.]|uniref:TonB-dependent receptor plug domain-containing protein n=1 Tax=Sphingorhabdus sp. TaxID=1902408 RepID=UPI0039837B44
MRLFKTILLTASIMSPVVAHADDGANDTIIVTASRGETPLSQVGQSVTVITADDIKTRQSTAVVDLLRTVPGVTFTRNGGIGTSTSVNIRGADSDQTVALIDGVKLNDPSSPGSGFNFGNLLTGNISRIEVVRGSQSVLWGSQAIGGVINIITREPTEDLTFNANAEYGWRDTGQVIGNVSGKFGPVSASVGAGYLRSDSFSAFNEARGATERDGYENYSANAKFNIAISEAVSFDLRGWYSNGTTGIDGFPAPLFAFGDTNETAQTEEFVGYAGLNAALFDGRFRNRFAYAYTDTARENLELSGAAPFQTFDAKGKNQRLEYQGNFEIADGYGLTIGAETERSSFRTVSFGGPASIADARLDSFYGQLSATPATGLTLSAGARYDESKTFGGKTVLAANGVYSPNDGATTIRASYGEGFKVPSLFQLFSNFGNTTLKPESSKGWDAGVTQKLLDGAIEAGGTWFHRDTSNQIVFVSCPLPRTGICTNRPFGTYDNVARTRTQGLEFGLKLKPVEALTVQANYSWIDANNRANGLKLARR